ncbi:hypothetical protein Plhal304r1_c021g0073411 [Plasmopara halstedii]
MTACQIVTSVFYFNTSAVLMRSPIPSSTIAHIRKILPFARLRSHICLKWFVFHSSVHRPRLLL